MMLGYCRVSTSEQAADDRSSLQEQERVIRAFAMLKGIGAYDLSIYIDAGVSGAIRLKDRPEGGRLLVDAKRNDIIIASKLDRIFRNALDAQMVYEELKERGVDLILYEMGTESVIKDSMSKCFFIVMSAFANLDKDRIRERMLEGKRNKQAKGGHVGGEARYGFRIVGQGREARLEMDPEEQKVVSLVNSLALTHDQKSIIRQLEERNIKTRTGKSFVPIQIDRILQAAQQQGNH